MKSREANVRTRTLRRFCLTNSSVIALIGFGSALAAVLWLCIVAVL